jgi:hypothetical protein
MEEQVMNEKLVHHLSVDLVSISLAQQWGEEFNLNVQPRFPKEGLFPPDGSGLIADLNHLSLEPGERHELFRRMAYTLLPYPLAIASYDVDERQIKRMERKRLVLGRWVNRDLIKRLANAVEEDRKDEAA